MGKILWVDLSNGKITEEPLDEKMARDYLGGYGLGARISSTNRNPALIRSDRSHHRYHYGYADRYGCSRRFPLYHGW